MQVGADDPRVDERRVVARLARHAARAPAARVVPRLVLPVVLALSLVLVWQVLCALLCSAVLIWWALPDPGLRPERGVFEGVLAQGRRALWV